MADTAAVVELVCPGCGQRLDPGQHGDLVFDVQVWCGTCHSYPPELVQTRDFAFLEVWGREICSAFGEDPVPLRQDPLATTDWRRYWQGDMCQLGEADHRHRSVLLYPPGLRLTSLCHELAHIFTGQDHTPAWATRMAALIAFVKERLLPQ